MTGLSPRLRAVADALPLRPGLRVLEIGSGTGALARELVRRGCEVVAVDHRLVALEDLALADGEAPFDVVVAVRVGVLDGRHPDEPALGRVGAVLAPDGRAFVERDGVLADVTHLVRPAAC